MGKSSGGRVLSQLLGTGLCKPDHEKWKKWGTRVAKPNHMQWRVNLWGARVLARCFCPSYEGREIRIWHKCLYSLTLKLNPKKSCTRVLWGVPCNQCRCCALRVRTRVKTCSKHPRLVRDTIINILDSTQIKTQNKSWDDVVSILVVSITGED